jgi:hypothetical protein
LQKLHTVKYSTDDIQIIVDKANPTTFLLNNEESKRICKTVDKKIIIGEIVEIDFHPACFYDKCVYFLKRENEEGENLDVRMLYLPS